MAATFTPVPRPKSATVAAEEELRRRILDGSLPPGSQLPPERALCGQLGVSRLTLRAALATLTAADLVAPHHGRGYVVRDVRHTGGTALLGDLVRMADEASALPAAVADLLRIRRHLAAAVLDALAERPPAAAARRAIVAAVDAFAAAVEAQADPEALATADLAVVAALLDATGSMVLRVCLNPVTEVVARSARLRAALYHRPVDCLLGWRALARWLDAPTAAAVSDLLSVLAAGDRAIVARLRRAR